MSEAPPSTALAVRRWAVIAAAGLSGVLVLVSMLVDPAPSASGRELIASYSEHSTASGLHTNLIHYGFVLIAPVVYVMVGMVRGRGAALANLAGLLAILGLSTLPGLVMLDLTAVAAAQTTDLDTAVAIDERLGEMPAFGLLIIPAFVGAMFALMVAVIALWRAGLVHGGVAAAGVVGALGPHFAPTWWLGFGLNTAWMLGLAYVLWRMPLTVWWGSPPGVVRTPSHVAAAQTE